MNKTEKNRLLSVILIATFLFMVGSPVLADAQPVFRLDKLNVAPNVDKVDENGTSAGGTSASHLIRVSR